MIRKTVLSLVVMMASFDAAGAQDASAVSARELAVFKSRFERVQKLYAVRMKELEEDVKEADDGLEAVDIKKAARPWMLGWLRFVLMNEEDLRLLADPKDEVDASIEPSGISPQVRRKVMASRQDIRDAERERIKAELKDGRGVHSDERTEKSIYRDEMSLDSGYERTISNVKRDLDKAKRNLSREKDSRRRDDQKVAEFEKEIEELEKQLASIHLYFYGFAPGVGFEMAAKDDSEVGKFQAELAAKRNKALRFLRGEEEGGEGEKKGGLVGGSFLYSANLGVVLDVSGSMTPHIEKLKKEIAETFEVPRYREVKGCRIDGKAYGSLDITPKAGARIDTMLVAEDLVAVHGVDTLYWFCDLRDGFDFAGLRRLRHLLQRGGSAFHVKSMQMRPDRELKPLITDFQGG